MDARSAAVTCLRRKRMELIFRSSNRVQKSCPPESSSAEANKKTTGRALKARRCIPRYGGGAPALIHALMSFICVADRQEDPEHPNGIFEPDPSTLPCVPSTLCTK